LKIFGFGGNPRDLPEEFLLLNTLAFDMPYLARDFPELPLGISFFYDFDV